MNDVIICTVFNAFALGLVGSTVDVKAATYTNSIGAPLLKGFWRDAGLRPRPARLRSRGRVPKSPPLRWTAYDCKRFDIKMPAQVPMIVTNRAYTSPNWYNPTAK